ncbi:tryptophan synthase subunit alpha [Actinokineospora enzanensis]|uniref:tryptophan synthase subunit alpha n=1 Tax=Actinokineospora enzanensis TaxID=155975 RepID=UPI00037D2C07|nr:tryptophan synthase subunit alpha [Actinokineospora enzanensis]
MNLRSRGRKLLVPYVTAGVSDNWLDHVHAAVDAGADAVEIGIPFSDPVIDGPVIQAASVRALERGTTPSTVARDLARYRGDVPLIAMTYYNLAHNLGLAEFADLLVSAGIAGTILPDLPIEESAPWERAAADAGLAAVLLAAPTTPDDRLAEICRRSRGFVYGMGLLGVTGERPDLATSARTMARRITAVTDLPALIGVGVSKPEHAATLATDADGVIVGTPVVRRILESDDADQVATLVAQFRTALDTAAPPTRAFAAAG